MASEVGDESSYCVEATESCEEEVEMTYDSGDEDEDFQNEGTSESEDDVDGEEGAEDMNESSENQAANEEDYRVDSVIEIGNIDFTNLSTEEVMKYHFPDFELAGMFYKSYAKVKGFGVRRSKQVKNKEGEIVEKTFLCSKAGHRDEKYLNMPNRKREARLQTRCGCPAAFRVRLNTSLGQWHVSYFCEFHSHDLFSGKHSRMHPSHRNMDECDVMQMNNLRDVGVSTPHIYELFVKMCGGQENMDFIKQDAYNQIEKLRRQQTNDAKQALKYLVELRYSDAGMFWRHTVDSESRLENLFWSDGDSRTDYEIFGDVIAFDATYKRNKYMCPPVVFSGVNHHNQTIIFGAGLVAQETEEIYVWLLEQFLVAMKGKTPVSVITDGDLAIRNAIRRVFPNSYHRLCAWHLLRNATANVGMPAFTRKLKHCMLDVYDIGEFELKWNEVVTQFRLEGHRWVNELYARRHMWATAHIRGNFFAGFSTTSRCEALHAQLGKYVHARNNIYEFVKHYFRCLSSMRFREIQADYDSVKGEPVYQTTLVSLERSAAKHYTLAVFKKFWQVLFRVASTIVVDCNETPTLYIYKVTQFGKPDKVWHVSVYMRTVEMKCSCKNLESVGIPFEHIVSVIVFLHIDELPRSLILTRWSKCAKEGVQSRNRSLQSDSESIQMTRYAALVQACKQLCHLACRSHELYIDYMEKIMNEAKLLESQMNVRSNNETYADSNVGDPSRVQYKGCGQSRALGGNRARRMKKCGVCRKQGHNRKSCPLANGGANLGSSLSEVHLSGEGETSYANDEHGQYCPDALCSGDEDQDQDDDAYLNVETEDEDEDDEPYLNVQIEDEDDCNLDSD